MKLTITYDRIEYFMKGEKYRDEANLNAILNFQQMCSNFPCDKNHIDPNIWLWNCTDEMIRLTI